MEQIEIRDYENAGADGQYFTATCSHVYESEESDQAAKVRSAWYKTMRANGFRTKVAFLDANPVGFLHLIPIEYSHWGPIGQDLMVILCQYVDIKLNRKGIGKALLQAAEAETIKARKKALVVHGYYFKDFWFMPAAFYEKHGYEPIVRKKVTKEGEKMFLEEEALLWKVFEESAEIPSFPTPHFTFQPVKGKIVIDLFSDPFCKPIEAQRVKEVAVEFGDQVVLNEYSTDKREVFEKYQISRAILINGQEIGWGYNAPREGIREAIQDALQKL